MTNRYDSDDTKHSPGEAMEAGENLQDGVTRRDFMTSTAAATGALLGASSVLAGEGGNDQVEATNKRPDWASLRGRIQGDVVTPDHPGFATVRSDMVWNNLKPNR